MRGSEKEDALKLSCKILYILNEALISSLVPIFINNNKAQPHLTFAFSDLKDSL